MIQNVHSVTIIHPFSVPGHPSGHRVGDGDYADLPELHC